MTAVSVFAVQDRTGTVAQFTTSSPGPTQAVQVGDTANYVGDDWDGVSEAYQFTVWAVNDSEHFVGSTLTSTGAPGNVMNSGWPKTGTITWLTGNNANTTTAVDEVDVANAYCDVAFFESYHASRGNAYPASPISAIEQAIVQATDYLDQRYSFKGVKSMQILSNPVDFDPYLPYIDPWLSPFGATLSPFGPGGLWLDASFTDQATEWPRQGVIDFNGDNVYGVPLVIKRATAECALRVLNGTPLQPDYDPSIVTAGGVLETVTADVGPIRTTTTYDTKLGLGFFPDIPHVRRMLTRAGILVTGNGRRIIR